LERRERLAQQSRGYRHADDAARLGRTGRTARHASRAARTADTAADAARAGRYARKASKLASTGKFMTARKAGPAGVAAVLGDEAMKATTGLDIPVFEFGVRAAATPFVAADGGDGGAYFVDQSEWFVGEVETGFRHFGETVTGQRSVRQNVRADGREDAGLADDLRRMARAAAPGAGLAALINRENPLDC
jgi:hypothetical protein